MSAALARLPGKPSPVRAAFGASVAARLEANPAVRRAKSSLIKAYFMPDFLSHSECRMLCALIDSKRRPSTLLIEADDPDFRTSESCDMDRFSPQVQPIDERIAALLGLDPRHGETMQGQRYAPGQQFRAHHDYFNESQSYWPDMDAVGGQRTWTAMVYLNEVEDGGATWFPQAGLRVPPRTGMLLAWNNMADDGSPNLATLHEGMAVMSGTKYIVTKWFRERYWYTG